MYCNFRGGLPLYFCSVYPDHSVSIIAKTKNLIFLQCQTQSYSSRRKNIWKVRQRFSFIYIVSDVWAIRLRCKTAWSRDKFTKKK